MADIVVKPVWALKLKDGTYNSFESRNKPFPRVYEKRSDAVEDKRERSFPGVVTRLELVLRETK